jgi:flagellin
MEEKIMALVVNTNIYSLNAQRNLTKNSAGLQTALQRLSSGLRINSAKDDASGLGTASTLTSQIRELNVTIRLEGDTISKAQVAEGALDEVTNIAQRMRELTFSEGTGSTEATQLATTANNIISNTNFGTQNAFTAAGITVSTTFAASDTASTLAASITAINGHRTTLGAQQSAAESRINNLANVVENVSAARSRILDADFAAETAALTRSQILQQAGVAMVSQSNQIPQAALGLLQ